MRLPEDSFIAYADWRVHELHRELQLPHTERGPARRHHRDRCGASGRAGLRSGLGPWRRGGALRVDRRGSFRRALRRHPFADLRGHRSDDRSHGGHRHVARLDAGRGADRGGHGRVAAGALRVVETRPVRRLHTPCGRFRIHVRDRHHHRPDPDSAVLRSAAGGRSRGLDPRPAERDRQRQPQRARHRCDHAGHCPGLAAPPVRLPALDGSSSCRRHAGGRAVAHRRTGNRRDDDQPARTAFRTTFGRLPHGCRGTGDDPCPARLRGQPAHVVHGRFGHGQPARPEQGTRRPGSRQYGCRTRRGSARRRQHPRHVDQHPRRRNNASLRS